MDAHYGIPNRSGHEQLIDPEIRPTIRGTTETLGVSCSLLACFVCTLFNGPEFFIGAGFDRTFGYPVARDMFCVVLARWLVNLEVFSTVLGEVDDDQY